MSKRVSKGGGGDTSYALKKKQYPKTGHLKSLKWPQMPCFIPCFALKMKYPRRQITPHYLHETLMNVSTKTVRSKWKIQALLSEHQPF